jgi:hypothetical protein
MSLKTGNPVFMELSQIRHHPVTNDPYIPSNKS